MPGSLLARTQAAISRHGLLPSGSRILLGLSGGVDSVTLADALLRLAPEAGWELHALYVNHGLRPEAETEATELEAYCEKIGLSYRTVRVAIAKDGRSPEEAARHARYDALNAHAAEIGATHLALAHHADDQLETILFRWVQGAGASGIKGMRPLREQKAGPPVVRPLLEVSRADIEAYHAERSLPSWEDLTNRDPSIPRNLLRQRVVPVLKQLNPRLLESLPFHLDLLSAENDWLEHAAREAETPLRRVAREGLLAWDRAGFGALPRVLRRRALHAAFQAVGGRLRQLTAPRIESVLDRWEAEKPGALDMGDGVRGLLHGAWVALDRDPAPVAAIPLRPTPSGLAIALEGGILSAELVGPEAWAAWKAWHEDARDIEREEVFFAGETWPADAVLRRADPARDQFVPWGHLGTHALNRFLTRAKVFEPLRRRLWVIASGKEVLWVVGMRRSARFALPNEAKMVFKLTWDKEAGFDNPPFDTYHEG